MQGLKETTSLINKINTARKTKTNKQRRGNIELKIKQLTNGCIVVTSHNPKRQYLSIRYEKKDIEITRLMFYVKRDERIKKLFVCHHCNNGRCINIRHLFLGSQKDNIDDCVNKKRHCFGERNGLSKLTKKQVKKMRKLYKIGEWKETKKRCWGKQIHSNKYYFKRKYPASLLAQMFGVCKSVAQNVVSYVTWKNVG